MLEVAGREADGAQLRGRAAVRALARLALEHRGVDPLLEVAETEAQGRAPSEAGAGVVRTSPYSRRYCSRLASTIMACVSGLLG